MASLDLSLNSEGDFLGLEDQEKVRWSSRASISRAQVADDLYCTMIYRRPPGI